MLRPIGDEFEIEYGDGTRICYRVIDHVLASEFPGSPVALRESVKCVGIVVGAEMAGVSSNLSVGDVLRE